MILFKKITDLRKWLDAQQENGASWGFVPTMGALHEGHISLIKASRKENPITVCSIFVNPTQFNDPGDFEKYPVTIEQDIDRLEEAGCDLLFLPSVKEIYPHGLETDRHYELGYLETILEGQFRPGHFQGVCRVVERLLRIVRPRYLYLGQKDYQQCMVISRLIGLMGAGKEITPRISPTLREADGLAMSSRNLRLSAQARKKAVAICESLEWIKRNIQPGDLALIKKEAESALVKSGFKVDYVEIADAGDLTLLKKWDGKKKIVALIAAFLGEVRLIDNMLLNEGREG